MHDIPAPNSRPDDARGVTGIERTGNRFLNVESNWELTPEKVLGTTFEPGVFEYFTNTNPWARAAYYGITSIITSANVDFRFAEGEDFGAQGEVILDACRWCFMDRPTADWRQFLRETVNHAREGVSIHEILTEREAFRRTGSAPRILWAAGLDVRLPRTIQDWIPPESRGHDPGVVQSGFSGFGSGKKYKGPVTIPGEWLFRCTYEQEGDNWQGVSMLRAAYVACTEYEAAMKLTRQILKRFGLGIPHFKLPPNSDPGTHAKALSVLQRLQGSHEHEGLTSEQDWQLIIESGPIQAMDWCVSWLRYLGADIQRVMLAQVLNSGERSFGSYSVRKGEDNTLRRAVEDLADYICRRFEKVLTYFVRWNFGPSAPVPALFFDGIESEDVNQWVQSVATAANANMLDLLEEQRAQIHERLGLEIPAADEDGEDDGGTMETDTPTQGITPEQDRRIDEILAAARAGKFGGSARTVARARILTVAPSIAPTNLDTILSTIPEVLELGEAKSDPPLVGTSQSVLSLVQQVGTGQTPKGLAAPFLRWQGVPDDVRKEMLQALDSDTPTPELPAPPPPPITAAVDAPYGFARSGRPLRASESRLDLDRNDRARVALEEALQQEIQGGLRQAVEKALEQAQPLVDAGNPEPLLDLVIDLTELGERLARVLEQAPVEGIEQVRGELGLEQPIVAAVVDGVDTADVVRSTVARILRQLSEFVRGVFVTEAENVQRGGLGARRPAPALITEATAGAVGAVKRVALGAVRSLIQWGRRAETVQNAPPEQRVPNLPPGVVLEVSNSAESNTCPSCERLDGVLFYSSSPAAARLLPPLSVCESIASGLNLCNCAAIGRFDVAPDDPRVVR